MHFEGPGAEIFICQGCDVGGLLQAVTKKKPRKEPEKEEPEPKKDAK